MPLQPYTQTDFLELWRRVLPRSYTEPIETEGGGVGFDLPSAHAAIWARVEVSLNLTQQGYYLRAHSSATGPIAASAEKATGQVLVTRAAPTVGAITLPVGTVFRALARSSLGGELFLGRYFSTATVTLPQGSVGPFVVPVEAEFPGYTGNLDPGYITEFQTLGSAEVPVTVATTTTLRRAIGTSNLVDRFEPGFGGRYLRLVGTLASHNGPDPRLITGTFVDGTTGELGVVFTPALDNGADVGVNVTAEVEEYADLGLTVTQPDPIVGGTPDGLGALGTDRAIARAPGETEANFRNRLGQLADTISPASHIRILNRILGSAGIGYEYLETMDVDTLMGFTWGVHPWGVGTLEHQARLPGSQLVGQGIVWLARPRHRRYFVVLVDGSGLGEYGMPWGSISYPPGHPNAWGLGIWTSGGGTALGFNALISQLWQELNGARLAGVAFQIFLR